ncbi:MAG: hypothetical protein V5A23_01895 [Halobacteriales archaeon]
MRFVHTTLRRGNDAGERTGTPTVLPDGGFELPEEDFELVDPEELLRTAGAVEPCEELELCLTDSFESELVATADSLGGGERRDDGLRTLFGADDGIRIETEEGRPVAYEGDDRRHSWPSEAAMVADLAAHRVLSDRDGGWDGVSATQKLNILRALRGFLETCPVCGGEVVMTEETVASCCRDWEVVAVRCRDCEAHFVELNPELFDKTGGDVATGPAGGGFTR